jgi:tetratricopeptide (TPR) repeat protein
MGFWKNLFGLGSTSAADHNKRGLVRVQEGAIDQAIAEFTEAIRLDPQDRGAYHDRAVAYIQIGEYERAIADLTAAAKLEPWFAPIYHNRGSAHAKREDYSKAIGDFTKAITLDARYASPLGARAEAFVAVSDYTHALADLCTLFDLVDRGGVTGPPCQMSPSDILVWQAEIGIRIGDYDRSITRCNNAQEYNASNWMIYLIRGLASAKKGDSDAAAHDYGEATKHQPPDWYRNKLRCLERVLGQAPENHELRRRELNAFGTWVLEYRSISVGNTMEVTELLLVQPTTSQERKWRRDLVARILRTPGEFIPLVFYRLAVSLFTEGKKEEAIFWLNVGRLRTWYDACRCADMVARNTSLRDIEAQLPEALRQAEYQDRQLHARVVQEVLDWDEKTPYFYDHRWIYQHSSGAYIASMGPEKAEAAGLQEVRDPDAEPGALSLPEKRWPEIRQQARRDFQTGLEERIHRPAEVAVAEGTACNLQLQQDVLEHIRMVEGPADGDLGRLVKAEVLEVPKEITSFGVGMLQGSWKERWEVARPGKTMVYEILFQADGQGGTYFTIKSADGRDATIEWARRINKSPG